MWALRAGGLSEQWTLPFCPAEPRLAPPQAQLVLCCPVACRFLSPEGPMQTPPHPGSCAEVPWPCGPLERDMPWPQVVSPPGLQGLESPYGLLLPPGGCRRCRPSPGRQLSGSWKSLPPALPFPPSSVPDRPHHAPAAPPQLCPSLTEDHMAATIKSPSLAQDPACACVHGKLPVFFNPLVLSYSQCL